jgi:hypothetical protein
MAGLQGNDLTTTCEKPTKTQIIDNKKIENDNKDNSD